MKQVLSIEKEIRICDICRNNCEDNGSTCCRCNNDFCVGCAGHYVVRYYTYEFGDLGEHDVVYCSDCDRSLKENKYDPIHVLFQKQQDLILKKEEYMRELDKQLQLIEIEIIKKMGKPDPTKLKCDYCGTMVDREQICGHENWCREEAK